MPCPIPISGSITSLICDRRNTVRHDPERRWLNTLRTENQWGRNLQNLSYRFDNVGNIEERTDASGRYMGTQSYSYDGLYQLETAGGTYVNKPAGHTSWTDRYSQSFSYDGLGNILKKTSSETRVPSASVRPLNYELDYEYDEARPHLATKIGELYYSYDANGNVTRESTLPEGQSSAHEAPNLTSIGEIRRADQAFGFINEVESGNENEYIRSFNWDAENRLKSVLTSNGKSVKYLYDADGKRSTKYAGDGSYTEGISGETLYFNEWWTETADSGSFRRAKHIYVGMERIVMRLSNPSIGGDPYEDVNTYYYHPDHLGSAHCITDPQGNPYERIEYTPYGEMWIEIQEDAATASYKYIPFRFTAKEYDEETGLYYYGARYLDPKTSRWMSGDPAGFGLLNPMEKDQQGKLKPKTNYSMIEGLNWHSYVSINPVRYVDPTGMAEIDHENKMIHADLGDIDDMDAALTMLSALGNEGYSVLAMNDQGYGFGFDNYGDMLRYLETVDPTGIDPGTIGDIATYASLAMNVAGMVSLFVAPPAAPGFFGASAGLDFVAAAAYAADGDFQSMAFSMASGTLEFGLPSPGFNAAAGRFTRAGTSRFMKANSARFILGAESLISPTLFGADIGVDRLRR